MYLLYPFFAIIFDRNFECVDDTHLQNHKLSRLINPRYQVILRTSGRNGTLEDRRISLIYIPNTVLLDSLLLQDFLRVYELDPGLHPIHETLKPRVSRVAIIASSLKSVSTSLPFSSASPPCHSIVSPEEAVDLLPQSVPQFPGAVYVSPGFRIVVAEQTKPLRGNLDFPE